jgi:integrase
MASLRARHTRACVLGSTELAIARGEGCTCQPTYYVAIRDGRSFIRVNVGKNRRSAERALTKIQGEVDEDAFVPQKRIGFDEWGGRSLDGLELPSNTVRSYRSTITKAIAVFGGKAVRRLAVEDVKRFAAAMREQGNSDSTRGKHIRVLGACLQSAILDGYASRNPVRELRPGERPRGRKKESAYFEADELPRLFAELGPGVYRTLTEVALKTGMRLGELSALTWGDVDLVEGVVRVRRSYTDGNLGTTKNRENRDVLLAPEVVTLLGKWWGECGRPAEDRLVLPGETVSGYLNPHSVLRQLYGAMERAGIARVGPTGEKRTFHSLRHTHAKVAIESGRLITWLSRSLGHSSLSVTTEVYGHFERAERKREAEAMEGAFGAW